MSPRIPRVLLVVGLALIGSATLLVGAEAAYRYRTARSVQVRYYRHARVQRALERDVDYNGVVHINRFGFRGPDFDSIKAPGTTRIILVGASTTFDPCALRDRETWGARLEQSLRELVPGRQFEVINAGVPGFPMLEQVIRLQTELYAFAPDVFVLYAGHGIVSAADARLHTAGSAHTPDAAPVVTAHENWLRKHSRLYERLRPQWPTEAGSVTLNNEQWNSAVDNAARDFERHLTHYTLIARSMGAKVVFAEVNRVTGDRAPGQFNAAERAAWQMFGTPPEVIHAGYQRFHAIWQSVADSVGATFIPAADMAITGPENFCPGDAIHFNTAGSAAMGRRLAEQLLARGVVTR